MSSPPEVRSSLLEFLDSFLQERNIRWILVAGLAILFGSSVMLVTTHWHEAGPVWKYLVFIGYTAVAFAAGQYVCPKLGLDRTATVLLALVGLLLPVTFIAWRWTWLDANDTGVLQFLSALTLVANTALAGYAGREFRRLLREDQFTFLGSYIVLCVGGAMLPACSPALLLPASVLLWGVFTIGTVKVNRHVFWLTEEMKLPSRLRLFPSRPASDPICRIAGVLRGAACKFGVAGYDCRAVFVNDSTHRRQRRPRLRAACTGGILWPWPTSVAVPMATGLLICLCGVVLAASGVPLSETAGRWSSPRAWRRSSCSGLPAHGPPGVRLCDVWAGHDRLQLFAIFCDRDGAPCHKPVGSCRSRTTSAVGFLRADLSAASWCAARTGSCRQEARRQIVRRAGRTVRRSSFLDPTRALRTHAKAIGMVGLALTALFAAQERLFHSRLGVVGTIAAWLTACAGVVPFATEVLGVPLAEVGYILAFGCGAARLHIVGMLRSRTASDEQLLFQQASLIVSLALAIAFPVFALVVGPTSKPDVALWAAGLVIAVLLTVHSCHWRVAFISTAAILYFQALMVLVVLQNAESNLVPLATLGLSCQWVLARWFKLQPTTVVSQVFGMAMWRTLTVELTIALTLLWLPSYVLRLTGDPLWSASAWDWIAATAIIVWAFDQAAQLRHSFTALLGMLAVLGLACTIFMNVWGPGYAAWLPVVCGAMVVIGIPLAEALRAYQRRSTTFDPRQPSAARAFERPLVGLMLAVFVGLATGSIVVYTTPALSAGILACAGLGWFATRSRSPALRAAAAAVITWQIVASPCHFRTTDHHILLELTWVDARWLCFPMGLLAATAFAAWATVRRKEHNDIVATIDLQRLGLGMLCVVAGLCAIGIAEPAAWQITLALLAPTIVAAAHLYVAWRDQSEKQVWSALSLFGVALAYAAHWQLLPFEGQLAMFALLAAGVTMWGAGKWLPNSGRSAIYAGPLLHVGYRLPALNLLVALYRQATLAEPSWLGPSSLALLLTAGFYFWRGLEERRPAFVLLAALIANVSLFLVWHELQIASPQCYMIPLGATVLLLTELLRREIPEKVRDPLRYLGAIVVLVSPTFDMLTGSWLPFLTLMVVAVLVLLVAIGLRVRAIMYVGAGFLAADLAGMVVRGCVDHPQLLWVAGLAIGTTVVTLGAVCELKREALLARVRALSAALETWN